MATVWTANRFINSPASDGGRICISALKNTNREIKEICNNAGKGAAFFKTFFLVEPTATGIDPNFVYLTPVALFVNITNKQIH